MIKIINIIIKAIASFFSLILSFLPKSPFNLIDNSSIKDFLGYLNWIIPVNSVLAIGEAWLVAVGIFYTYSIALRWVKAIE